MQVERGLIDINSIMTTQFSEYFWVSVLDLALSPLSKKVTLLP